MKMLLIKTTSMGDVIHALPALTDAMKHIPNLEVDWVIEESFKDIPSWHPAVKKVIPVAMRRWRKSLFKYLFNGEIRQFIKTLRHEKYDVIIDAQGLMKSALITRLARGKRCGFGKNSTKEPVLWAYDLSVSVARNQHAVKRLRELFAKTLGYPEPQTVADYGIAAYFNNTGSCGSLTRSQDDACVMFVHGTTWPTKHWPETYWIELAKLVNTNGLHIKIPSGNQAELARAERIAKVSSSIEVLPKTSLTELAQIIASTRAIVAVDTGLSHLAAALNIPTVALYGPTDPNKIGTVGQYQIHLKTNFACCGKRVCTKSASNAVSPPCFAELTPEKVYSNLQSLL